MLRCNRCQLNNFNRAINIVFNSPHYYSFKLIKIRIQMAAIQWAPWNVPMHRRLEVLTTAFAIFIAIGLGPLACLFILYLLVSENILNKISNSTMTTYFDIFTTFNFRCLEMFGLKPSVCRMWATFITIEMPVITADGVQGNENQIETLLRK